MTVQTRVYIFVSLTLGLSRILVCAALSHLTRACWEISFPPIDTVHAFTLMILRTTSLACISEPPHSPPGYPGKTQQSFSIFYIFPSVFVIYFHYLHFPSVGQTKTFSNLSYPMNAKQTGLSCPRPILQIFMWALAPKRERGPWLCFLIVTTSPKAIIVQCFLHLIYRIYSRD